MSSNGESADMTDDAAPGPAPARASPAPSQPSNGQSEEQRRHARGQPEEGSSASTETGFARLTAAAIIDGRPH
jgi:hypothetical protein